MTCHPVRILSTTIAVPFAAAYDFAHRPEHFAQWARGLSHSLTRTDRGWIAETPLGQAQVRFADRNDFGILDHHVHLPGKPEIYIPLRMVANGDGVEVELMLFRQPDMTDADFARDAAMVEADLAALKALLEGGV